MVTLCAMLELELVGMKEMVLGICVDDTYENSTKCHDIW